MWQPAPSRFSLETGAVHVWRASLDNPPGAMASLRQSLSPDEEKRATRLVRPELGDRFRAGRGLLRHLLAHYLERPPEAIAFDYGEHGKPSVAREQNTSDLAFNVSHSRDQIIIAVTRHDGLGVDIEFKKESRDLPGLAERYYCEAEKNTLRQCGDAAFLERFYTYWCRKEAFLKATGKGLRLPLTAFDLSQPPHIRPVEIDSATDCGRWRIHDLPAISGFHAALCIVESIDTFQCFHWTR